MGNFLKRTLLEEETSVSADTNIHIPTSMRELPERFRDNPFFFEKLPSYFDPSLSDNVSECESTRSHLDLDILFKQHKKSSENLVSSKQSINDEFDSSSKKSSDIRDTKIETHEIVDYAAKEILTIGKKRRQRRNARHISTSLRRMKKKDERFMLEHCVKLYTQSPLLYRACHRDLNDYYSSDDNQLFNYRKLLQAYMDLYGKSYTGEVYRGIVLSEIQLKLHLANDCNTMWYSPTFLSASKSRKIGEIYGNVLMIINIQQTDDNHGKAVDISDLSTVPEEEEVILTPNYKLFKMKQPEFNPILEKIIIYLSSTRSYNLQDDERSNRLTPRLRNLSDLNGSDSGSFTWQLYLRGTADSDTSTDEDEVNSSSKNRINEIE